MTNATRKLWRTEWAYFRKYALERGLSWDLRIALAVFVAVLVSAHADKALRHTSHLLDVAAALGLALLAVVIAVISILTVFLTEDYGVILRATYPDDIGEVFYPYRMVAFVSCATTFVAVAGLFVWPVASSDAREAFVASALGLSAWATMGAFDLVRITAGHARLKMRMPELDEAYIAELKRVIQEHQRSTTK